jgi:receptor protein-tyrosine kinase
MKDDGEPMEAPIDPENQEPLTDLPQGWGFDHFEELLEQPDVVPSPVPIGRTARNVESCAPAARADLGNLNLNPADAGKLVIGPSAHSTLVEQTRRLAAALHHAQLKTRIRSVMVVSAVEAEGKTLTATNLALTLSQSYQRRVLLVDADLRRPSIHERFRLNNHAGLGDVLRQPPPDGELPVQRVSSTLWVMTAGRPDSDPMGGLVSDTMEQFLTEAGEGFDWIVIDTPPVVLLPDANLLAAMVDTAILVVGANLTAYPLVTRAIDAIGRSRILGVVLNRAKDSEASVGYRYYLKSSTRSEGAAMNGRGILRRLR